jgi:hypothetical protein
MEFRIGGDLSGDPDELAEHAATLTQRAVQLAVKSEDHVLVPLSGGLDSRGIAMHLPPVRVATAVSYGHQHSLELVYGRATADSLGIPWKAYPLDRHHFKRPFLSVVEQSGVMTHRMHCHMAGAVLSSGSEEVVLLPGFMGDLVQGLRWRLIEQTTSASSCAWFLLKKYRQTENSFNRMFPPEVRDAVLHDLEWLVRDATALHEPIQFDEYYYFVERQPKLITHIFNALVTSHIRLSFPYMDGAWARFFLSLQGRFRYQRKLFRDSLSRACPRVGELPSLGTGGVVTSWSRSRRSAMLQRIGQLQQIVEKLSFGKLSFPDPCQTENVRHVLRTVLIPKLRHSVRRLCDEGIVTAEVADEVCSARYKHLDAHAGFRLISLAEVIGIV